MNRTSRWIIGVILIINALLFSGCGSGSGEAQSDQNREATGDISLNLVWETPASVKSNLSRSAADPVLNPENGTIDCEQSGIATIYVRIYDQADGAILAENGDGWDCNDHSGTIRNVPVSSRDSYYRKLVCLARDENNNVVFRGEQSDIAVSVDETENVSVEMAQFTSDSEDLEDGEELTEDVLAFQCDEVANADHYQIQVATDASFENIVANETSTTNSFSLKPFPTSQTYYWRICPVDMHGSQGAWSTPRRVNVSLPPLATTNPATQVTPTSATLNGAVNPRGFSTTYWFEYRSAAGSEDSWLKTSEVEAGTEPADTAATASLQDLATETVYDFRLMAKNSVGTTAGDIQQFTTGDATGPTVVETRPDGNTANIPEETAIWARFDEPINVETLTHASFFVRDITISDGTSEIGGTISYENEIATFEPKALNTDATYEVTLTTAIEDVAGNPMSSNVTWRFTTIETDGPIVTEVYPSNTANGVQVLPTITAAFNETIVTDSLNSETFLVKDETTDTYISGTITYYAETITASFLPDDNLLCETTYTVTLTNDIRDNHGNPMAADKVWQFRTGENCGPSVAACKLAIKEDSTILAWKGNNSYGELGDGTYFDDPVWAMVTTGETHTVALRTDGSLWVWGNNRYGQLGIEGIQYSNTPLLVGVDKDWASVSVGAGGYHTIALKTDGSLWSWGWCVNGSCGETLTQGISPNKLVGYSDWIKISAGQHHSVALKADGSLWTWGDNAYGQLGDGEVHTYAMRTKPAQIGIDKDWESVTAGHNHTIALKKDGSLWGWGDNSHGQIGLGDGANAEINMPTRIGTDTNWTIMAAGRNHTLAMKTDGTLWAWGDNSYGQLGQSIDGANPSIPIPTKLEGHTNWVAVYAGVSTSMGLKTNGNLWQLSSGGYYSIFVTNLTN